MLLTLSIRSSINQHDSKLKKAQKKLQSKIHFYSPPQHIMNLYVKSTTLSQQAFRSLQLFSFFLSVLLPHAPMNLLLSRSKPSSKFMGKIAKKQLPFHLKLCMLFTHITTSSVQLFLYIIQTNFQPCMQIHKTDQSEYIIYIWIEYI